jgi:outer membrane protein assembly factor BamB
MKNFKFLYAIIAIAFISLSSGCPKDIFGPGPGPDTGDTLWVHEVPGVDSLFLVNSLAVGHNGTLYCAVAGGTVRWTAARVRALDPDNGNMIWESERMDNIGLNSEIMIGDDGTVYAIGNHKLYAFDGSTGFTKWIWEVPQELPNPDNPSQNVYTYGSLAHLALTDDGNILTSTSGSGVYSRSIFLINPFGDKIYHNIKANGWAVETGFAIGKNNMAYYYSRNLTADLPGLRLVALNLATGGVAWTLPIDGSYSGDNNIAIMEDGNLLAIFNHSSSPGSKAHIVDAQSGAILWTSSYEVTAGVKLIGPDGTFYEQVGPYKFSRNGSRTLATNFTHPAWANIGAITGNNRLVSAFTDVDNTRKLGAFNSSGTIDFGTQIDGVEGKKIVIGTDQQIYGIINLHPVSFIPTKIVAIQGNASLATTGWPRPGHDNQNTSNANK